MEKKYELLYDEYNEADSLLYRIKALRDFGDVKKGDLGGWIRREENLSQEGDCWVYDEAIVTDYARVHEDAKIYNYCIIFDNAHISGNAKVRDEVVVRHYAQISGCAEVSGRVIVTGSPSIYGAAKVYGSAKICDRSRIFGTAKIGGETRILGNTRIGAECDIQSERDYITIGTLGSRFDFITFYKTPRGIYVTCGCFTGSIETFEEQVRETHEGTEYMDQYLNTISYVKTHFGISL